MSELSLARSCLMTWVSSWISLLGSLNKVRRLVTESKGTQLKINVNATTPIQHLSHTIIMYMY